MNRWTEWTIVVALLPAYLVLACGSDSVVTAEDCAPGSEACSCIEGGACNGDLTCENDVCVSASTNQGGSSGGNATGGTSGSNGSGGTAPVGDPFCTMPSGSYVATNTAAATCGASQSVDLTIGESGYLESVEGQSCTLNRASSDNDCFGIGDTYDCGGCVFTTGEDLDGFLVGVDDCDAPCAASYCCPLPSGGTATIGYTFGATNTGGSGGSGSGGGGGNAACDDCLASCQGLSGCCTGSGCICMGACGVTMCLPGNTYCCGPDGFCFCTSSCPY